MIKIINRLLNEPLLLTSLIILVISLVLFLYINSRQETEIFHEVIDMDPKKETKLIEFTKKRLDDIGESPIPIPGIAPKILPKL